MSTVTAPIAVGLGSSQGDREAHLVAAIEALGDLVSDIEVGGLYESAAWELTASGEAIATGEAPPFLNTALVGFSRLSPQPLLAAFKFLEQRAGRERGPRWAPRPLDLDLLLFDDLVDGSPELTLPHPGLRHRPFVLAPLADVAPDLEVPPDGARVGQLLAAVDTGELVRRDWSRGLP